MILKIGEKSGKLSKSEIIGTIDSFVVNSNFCEQPCILQKFVVFLVLSHEDFGFSYNVNTVKQRL